MDDTIVNPEEGVQGTEPAQNPILDPMSPSEVGTSEESAETLEGETAESEEAVA